MISVDEYKVMFQCCRSYREKAKISRADVAQETGYTVSNIAMFERGYTNNMLIFMWYLLNVIPLAEVERWKRKHNGRIK